MSAQSNLEPSDELWSEPGELMGMWGPKMFGLGLKLFGRLTDLFGGSCSSLQCPQNCLTKAIWSRAMNSVPGPPEQKGNWGPEVMFV